MDVRVVLHQNAVADSGFQPRLLWRSLRKGCPARGWGAHEERRHQPLLIAPARLLDRVVMPRLLCVFVRLRAGIPENNGFADSEMIVSAPLPQVSRPRVGLSQVSRQRLGI
eukprot:9492290-Pyramimonas_sp.AAC.1